MMLQLTNSSSLKSFTIKRLFGRKDFSIIFDASAKIVMGENGSGKTTILNTLYYALTGNFRKLASLEFDTIMLGLGSGESIEIKKSDLFQDTSDYHYAFLRETRYMLPERDYGIFRRLLNDERYSEAEDFLISRTHWSRDRVRHMLEEMGMGPAPQRKLSKAQKSIQQRLSACVAEEVLYFPTYRRIEEDLKNLGCSIKDADSTLIQFGMDDVASRFEAITQTIKDSAIEWFSKVNGEMLSQLVDGIRVTREMHESIKQQDALKIVLDRVGGNLTEEYKNNIHDLVRAGTIFEDTKHDPLIYFLSNLIKIYDQQRERDNAIKKFAEVCNKYLFQKRVDYNESAVKIDIIQSDYNQSVGLSKLSSGEKQIVSLFSKIYLSTEKDFIILFDEPELSLSIEWQKHLLPDILGSGGCKLLFAATHSPFVFDNELDEYAIDLSSLMGEGTK
jgi:predicted ATPase